MLVDKRIYRLKPIVTDRVWGGTKLANKLNIQTDSGRAGEIVVAAGFSERDSEVEGLDIRISELYLQQPEIFGVGCPCFPLTVNLIDAAKALSVQVHPNNERTQQSKELLSLPEAWIVLDCEDDSHILVGHTAESNRMFKTAVELRDWSKLFYYIPAVKGAFFHLPPGTVHAIGGGVQIYEVTHASDTVYRLYDYDRADENRPLEVQKVLEAVYSPQHIEPIRPQTIVKHKNLTVTEYINEPGLYTIRRFDVSGDVVWRQNQFGILTLIKGSGAVNEVLLEAGQTILIPCEFGEILFTGAFTALMSGYDEKIRSEL